MKTLTINKVIFDYHFFLSKKFQGLVLSFDFDVPQNFVRQTYFVVTVKFLFFGFWIGCEKNNNYYKKGRGGLVPGKLGFYGKYRCRSCFKWIESDVELLCDEKIMCESCVKSKSL